MSAYEGYLNFGGNEIVNNSRVRGIAESAQPCPMFWLKGPTCDTMAEALIHGGQYDYASIDLAPWYDPDVPASRDFFGFFAHTIDQVLDSTRTVSRTEGIGDGGFLGRTRKATKTLRVRGLLMGRGRSAIEYGQAWLSAAVDPGTCGQHGSECGLTDLAWFADCPPTRGWVTVPGPTPEDPPTQRPQTDAEYAATVRLGLRYLHDVAAISGPSITGTLNAGDFWAYEVEIIFAAERPWVYGAAKDIDLPPTTPVIIQDVPYNLIPYPSAELAAGSVTIARNDSTNPSVETNATGWAVAVTAPITAGMCVGARSTDIAAVGAASYRVVFTATGAGVDGEFGAEQVVTLPTGIGADLRHSINLWATVVVGSGSPVLGDIEYIAVWRNAANAVLRTDTLGTRPIAGGSVSVKSIDPPATATNVVVRAVVNVASWANGNVIRLYADALAVTTP